MKKCCKESLDSIIKYCREQIRGIGVGLRPFKADFIKNIILKDSQYQDVINFIRKLKE